MKLLIIKVLLLLLALELFKSTLERIRHLGLHSFARHTGLPIHTASIEFKNIAA